MNTTELKKEENLFASGTIWFITCVFVTVLPTLCSCVFRFVTENKTLSAPLFVSKYLLVHLKDILLIAFSISCSLFALSTDKSKVIKKQMKKMGVIISGFAGVVSGFYYFYIDGRDNIYGENATAILFFYIGLIVLCSIIGLIIGNQHDKHAKNVKKPKKAKNARPSKPVKEENKNND